MGEPVELVGRSLDADTKRIMEALVDLLPADAYTKRKPSAEELALTYPPGYRATRRRNRDVDRAPTSDTSGHVDRRTVRAL